MTNQTTAKERYNALSAYEVYLTEIDEYRELVKQNEASLVKKDNEMSAMRDELARKDDELSSKDDELTRKDEVIRNLQNKLEQQKS